MALQWYKRQWLGFLQLRALVVGCFCIVDKVYCNSLAQLPKCLQVTLLVITVLLANQCLGDVKLLVTCFKQSFESNLPVVLSQHNLCKFSQPENVIFCIPLRDYVQGWFAFLLAHECPSMTAGIVKNTFRAFKIPECSNSKLVSPISEVRTSLNRIIRL